MKKMNFTSIYSRLTLVVIALLAMVADVNAQCREKLVLNHNAACSATLNYADLVVAGAPPVGNVIIRKPNLTVYTGTLPYVFGRDDIFNEFEVQHMGPQGMCITYVSIRDVLPPTAGARPTQTVRCTELVNGKLPAPGSLVWGTTGQIRLARPEDATTLAGVLTNPISGGTTTFATDDCFNYTVAVNDVYGPITDCPTGPNWIYQVVTRTFTLKDIWGNSADYTQTINVIKRPITIPTPIDINNCSTASVSTAGLPFIDWDGNGISDNDDEVVTPGVSYCGNSVLKLSETSMPTCGGSYMVMRQWKLTNCGVTIPVDQVVNVNDRFVPVMSFQYNDYKRIPKTQCRNMNGMNIQEFVYETSREAISDGGPNSTWIDATTGALNPNGEVTSSTNCNILHRVMKVTPLMNLGSCNTVTFESLLNVADPNCSSYPITIRSVDAACAGADARVTFNGMPEMQISASTQMTIKGTFSVAAMGDPDPFFYVTATDACGNTTRIKIIVVVIDNLAPNASCSGKEVTLTNRGEALITPDLLSMSPDDNCPGPYRKYIRRTTPTNDGCWQDNLVAVCADGTFKVDVRIIDMMGNYNDCCVDVTVRDKTPPTCPMSPDVTAVCTDTRLTPAAIASFFTQPVPFYTCEFPRIKDSTDAINISCGSGEVFKRWTFTNSNGSVTCTQKLIINPVPGFRMRRLRSQNLTCAAAFNTIEQDRAAIAAQFKNLNGQGRVTCSAPIIKITEMDANSGTPNCRRVMRMYEVYDKCLTEQPCATTLNLVAGGTVAGSATVSANAANDLLDASGNEIQVIGEKVCWTRIIQVMDNTPPTPGTIADKEVCADLVSCTLNFPTVTLTATDNCNADVVAPTWLFYRWEVRRGSASGTVIASGSGSGSGANAAFNVAATSTNGLAGLATGTYYVTWAVVDDCGNPAAGTPVKVVIKDCKSPYIDTHDKNTVLAFVAGSPGQGMSQVCVSEVLNAVVDNCTPEATLVSKLRFVRASANPTNAYPASIVNNNCIMFSCADLAAGTIPTQVWTVDDAGNAVFNIVTITVQDNNRACSTPTPQSVVSGTLKTETSVPAKNVTLTASTGGTITNTVATDADGSFTMSVPQGANYVLKAAKQVTDDKYAGISTFDIARISKHILDIEAFTSPYQAIAADVNKDNVIDAIDMVSLRNFILRKTANLPGGVWRFIDKSYTFRNPANPFGEDFPEVISLTNAKATETANFSAVKLGDVNGSFTANLVPTSVRSDKSLVLNVEDMDLVAGNEYTVKVSAENFNAAAFQGTFSIANATIKSVKAGDLANYGDGNFAMFANEFTTSWNGKSSANAEVFTVTFVANKSAKLSEVMTVGSTLTPAVANDAQGTEMGISLKFNSGKVKGGEFALHAATPNPVSVETNIGFVMPKDGAAKLTIYNVEGKVLVVKNVDAKAGLNNVTVSKSELNASGVMYYRLETADNSATKKFIVIE